MRSLRILLVEDDAILSTVFTQVLEDMGHVVVAVEATQTGAVASAVSRNPDLMLVDQWLSEGSGVLAVAEILRVKTIPFIFLSGAAGELQAAHPEAVVVEKPFREKQLARAIQQVCPG